MLCSIAYGQQSADTASGQQANPYIGEKGVANPLKSSIESINECYRGTHPYYGEDYVGKLIAKAGTATLTELQDICKKTGGGSPNIAIPIGPVEIPSDKACVAIQHKACVPD